MKKLLLFLSVALFCVSCTSLKGDGKIYCSWWIDNTTDQTLILKCPYSESIHKNNLKYTELELEPNTNFKICGGRVPGEINPSLDYYFEKSAEAFGEDVSWQILSEDGTLLKVWKYSDKDLSSQHFFDESSWDYTHNWEMVVTDRWVFEILPKDIIPE